MFAAMNGVSDMDEIARVLCTMTRLLPPNGPEILYLVNNVSALSPVDRFHHLDYCHSPQTGRPRDYTIAAAVVGLPMANWTVSFKCIRNSRMPFDSLEQYRQYAPK